MVIVASRLGVLLVACTSLVWACHNPVTSQELLQMDNTRKVAFYGFPASVLGFSVNAAGDCNGDGYADIVLAAPQADFGNANGGAIYLVFGRSATDWKNTPAETFNFSNYADTPNASSWIRICGSTTSEAIGMYGIAHGDFNGDGFSDIIFSTMYIECVYVVCGHSGAWESFNVNSISSGVVSGFRISTPSASVAFYVANAGDMNGDGIDDILATPMVGAGFQSYVVFGIQGDRTNFLLANVDGMNGFQLVGSNSRLGFGLLSSPGDFNGDGIADLAIGANAGDGKAFVVFARKVSIVGEWGATFNVSTLDGANGFIINGPPNSEIGATVVGAGDINGDGLKDLYIGSNKNGTYILFGHAAPWTESPIDISQLNGTDGFHIMVNIDQHGFPGGGIGDANGDGIDDIMIALYNAFDYSNNIQTGAAAVLFGHAGYWPAEIFRSDLVGSVAFQIDGPSINSWFGKSASGAGDLNGDGIADIVIGAPQYLNDHGFSVLVFGINDHCAVCSTISDDCHTCRDDGSQWNGTVCYMSPVASSSSRVTSTSIVVVVTDGASVSEVIAEIATLLGVDATTIIVVEVTPGTFEITVSSDSLAQQLVDAINRCITQQ